MRLDTTVISKPSTPRNLSRLILDSNVEALAVAVKLIVCSPDVLNAREAIMIVESPWFPGPEFRVSPSI